MEPTILNTRRLLQAEIARIVRSLQRWSSSSSRERQSAATAERPISVGEMSVSLRRFGHPRARRRSPASIDAEGSSRSSRTKEFEHSQASDESSGRSDGSIGSEKRRCERRISADSGESTNAGMRSMPVRAGKRARRRPERRNDQSRSLRERRSLPCRANHRLQTRDTCRSCEGGIKERIRRRSESERSAVRSGFGVRVSSSPSWRGCD